MNEDDSPQGTDEYDKVAEDGKIMALGCAYVVGSACIAGGVGELCVNGVGWLTMGVFMFLGVVWGTLGLRGKKDD